ncbi:uncharacterized protein BXZ73DRAFT_82912 [Epithele typhae]|uniref:uncharacterized protein n=1 Tax=Epithele typhae TaxID=378194 RepID=UPI00200857CA|nr:uncharacterized protein BXZ73DRAFT_82912 [Epithele typhae]KAH9911229.1 hypothetical protein BXZ73DRAFT_82912 [Epithele typhae]
MHLVPAGPVALDTAFPKRARAPPGATLSRDVRTPAPQALPPELAVSDINYYIGALRGDAEGSRGEVKGQDEAEQVVGNAGNAKGEEAQSSEGGRCERKDDVGGGGNVGGGHDVGWDDTEEGRVGGGGGRRRVTRRARGRRRRQRRYADAGDMEVGDDAEVADARGGGGPRVREAEEGVRAQAPEVCRRAARRRAENSAEVGNGEEGSGEVGQADAEIEVKAGGRPDVRSRRGEVGVGNAGGWSGGLTKTRAAVHRRGPLILISMLRTSGWTSSCGADAAGKVGEGRHGGRG